MAAGTPPSPARARTGSPQGARSRPARPSSRARVRESPVARRSRPRSSGSKRFAIAQRPSNSACASRGRPSIPSTRSSVAIASSYRRRSCSRPGAQRGLLGGQHRLLGEPRRRAAGAWRSGGASSSAASSHSCFWRPQVDEAEPLGLLGVDAAAGEHQLHRALLADHAREPLGAAAAGNDPERDLGLAELGRLGGDDQVAEQRELAAAAEREARDRRDQRRPAVAARRRQNAAAGWNSASWKVALGERADVGAGREHLVGAGDHDAADLGVGVERPRPRSASSSISSGESALRASGRFSRQQARRGSSTLSSRRRRGSPICATPMSAAVIRRHRVDAGRIAADDQLLDLRGALVEGGHPGVAQVALDRVVVDVAGAAVDLDREVRALDRRLGRVELGDRGLDGVRLARRP